MSLHHPATPADATEGADSERVPEDGQAVGAAVAAALLAATIAVALVAQFALDGLADTSDLWHWAQHGLLFWGGLGAGAALVILYRHGQRRA